MKITYPRTVLFHMEGGQTVRFTDARKAAEFWARAKEEEWVEKNKDNPKFKVQSHYGRIITSNQLHDEGRVRYRKMKRRALKIFRQILEVNS